MARARLNVEQTYDHLFQRLRYYPPDVLDRLKTALAEKQLAIERGVLSDHGPAGDTDPMAGKAKLDRILQEADEKIRATFEDEIYEQYTYVQQSEPLRGSIEQVTNVMRSRGVDVTDDMQERIMAGYTSALVSAAKVSANDTTPEAFQSLSDAARQELRAKQQARFDEISHRRCRAFWARMSTSSSWNPNLSKAPDRRERQTLSPHSAEITQQEPIPCYQISERSLLVWASPPCVSPLPSPVVSVGVSLPLPPVFGGAVPLSQAPEPARNTFTHPTDTPYPQA